MTEQESNETIAKRMGPGQHSVIGMNSAVAKCSKCGAIWPFTDSGIDCLSSPSYTTDYTALAAAEREVYGDKKCSVLWLQPDGAFIDVFPWSDGGPAGASIVGEIDAKEELHARAECLARVIREEEK